MLPGDGEVAALAVHLGPVPVIPTRRQRRLNEDVEPCAAGADLRVAAQPVYDLPRPGLDVTARGIAAVVQVDPNVGIIGGEHEAHAQLLVVRPAGRSLVVRPRPGLARASRA